MCGRSWWRRPQANAGVLLGGARDDPPVEDWLASGGFVVICALELERIISSERAAGSNNPNRWGYICEFRGTNLP